MKKLFIVILFCGVAKFTNAQQFEIYGSYGLGSAQELVDGLSDFGTSLVTAGQINRDTKLKYGPAIIGLNYYATHRLSVGALYSRTSSRSDIKIDNNTQQYSKNSYNVVMARSDYRWINHTIQLYSGIAAGAAFSKAEPNENSYKTEKETYFAYQVNAIGIRAGRKLGAFAELGFGYNGILNLGVSLKL